jgi:hypothetical protein
MAAGLLLLAATTLLATGSLYSDTVALGGLRRAILDAPPADRALLVSTTLVPDDVESVDPAIAAQLRRAIATTGGTVGRVLISPAYADASIDPDDVTELRLLVSHDTIADHAQLVEGSWPTAGSEAIEAAVSEGGAIALGLGVGDETRLVGRRESSSTFVVRVVGIWRPDRDDAYWLGRSLELDGVEDVGSYATQGPFVVAEADLLGRGLAPRLEGEWRAVPDVDGLRIDSIDALGADVGLLPDRLRAALPSSRQVRVATQLPSILDEVDRAVLVSRSGVLLLTIQFAVLAIYAVTLVGGLLLERRRAEVALLRSRGASNGHLVSMAIAEALLLALPAAVIAPWLALALVDLLGRVGPLAAAGIDVRASVTPSVMLVAALAGLGCTAAIVLPVLASGVRLAGIRAAIGRQGGRTLAQRLGIDVALVVLAGIGLWQLRLYGAPLTRNARGVLGVDPLLVAAPAIGLLAGGILAVRVVPRLAEIGERLLERRRGLVAPLSGRQLARRPLRYTRAALLLILAAGLGTFASAHAATWTRSQSDQAAYQAAADVRVVVSEYADLPDWAIGGAYRAVAGVDSAMPAGRLSFDAGPQVRGRPMLTVDPAALPAVAAARGEAGSAGASPVSPTMIASLADGRPAVAAVDLPGTPQRLTVSVRSALEVVFSPDNVPVPDDTPAVRAHVVVQDGDGRIHRLASGGTGPLVGSARLDVPLGASVGDLVLRPAFPLRLLAVELEVFPTSLVALEGAVELEGVAVGAATGDGGSPLALTPSTPGWSWERIDSGAVGASLPTSPDAPWRLVISSDPEVHNPTLFQTAFFRLRPELRTATTIPAIVGSRFLELTGSGVGDEVSVTSRGIRMSLRIIGATDEFAPLDPEEPFVVVDATTVELLRFAAVGLTVPADEWWLAVTDARETEVTTALAGAPYSAASIVAREALVRDLTSDPVSLGVIGVLGLGAAAALVFAAIGFVVNATVSASERIGEFAVLQALGLSGRQLSIWLSVESAFLLVVGLVAGSALGFLLAWLVLPFATLTETGVPAVPTPVVVVPWLTIAPAWVLAIALLAVTIVAVRRQLPARRISGVLRATDE